MAENKEKCSSCKCYWEKTENDIKTSGKYYKTCQKCRKGGMSWENVVVTRVYTMSMEKPPSLYLSGFTDEIRIDPCFGEFTLEAVAGGKNILVGTSVGGVLDLRNHEISRVYPNHDNLSGLLLSRFERFTFTFDMSKSCGTPISVIQTTNNIIVESGGRRAFKYIILE